MSSQITLCSTSYLSHYNIIEMWPLEFLPNFWWTPPPWYHCSHGVNYMLRFLIYLSKILWKVKQRSEFESGDLEWWQAKTIVTSQVNILYWYSHCSSGCTIFGTKRIFFYLLWISDLSFIIWKNASNICFY